MIRSTIGTLAPAFFSLFVAAAAHAPVLADGFKDRALVTPARTACDGSGRCFEIGDPGYRDDDAPSPRRRYDPDGDDRPPPPRHRYDPDGDDRSPPPRRYDPDGDN